MERTKCIDNKTKQWFLNLKKDGYYLRPQKFDNCTIVQMTKDLNPVNCKASRKTIFEVNTLTAKEIVKCFGFKIIKPIEYFGKAEPIPTGFKRTFFNS